MKSVATHNGPFHADDVFAIAILKQIFPDLEYVRTRDPKLLESQDARVDVGLKYDHETKDYDHHQPEGAGVRENEIPYASCGLIWLHYGRELCPEDEAWEKIDKKLIQPIDASDNGFEFFEAETIWPYLVSDVIKSCNPNWKSDDSFDLKFEEALKLATAILLNEVDRANVIVEANEYVREAIKDAGDLVVLEKRCPWKRIVSRESEAKLVVYQAQDSWRVQVVPEKEEGFQSRIDLPNSWGGLEAEALSKLTGVEDAIFCHRGLFLAGAKSKEGALKLAKLALSEQ